MRVCVCVCVCVCVRERERENGKMTKVNGSYSISGKDNHYPGVN
jgi:hypothetical protein